VIIFCASAGCALKKGKKMRQLAKMNWKQQKKVWVQVVII